MLSRMKRRDNSRLHQNGRNHRQVLPTSFERPLPIGPTLGLILLKEGRWIPDQVRDDGLVWVMGFKRRR